MLRTRRNLFMKNQKIRERWGEGGTKWLRSGKWQGKGRQGGEEGERRRDGERWGRSERERREEVEEGRGGKE